MIPEPSRWNMEGLHHRYVSVRLRPSGICARTCSGLKYQTTATPSLHDVQQKIILQVERTHP